MMVSLYFMLFINISKIGESEPLYDYKDDITRVMLDQILRQMLPKPLELQFRKTHPDYSNEDVTIGAQDRRMYVFAEWKNDLSKNDSSSSSSSFSIAESKPKKSDPFQEGKGFKLSDSGTVVFYFLFIVLEIFSISCCFCAYFRFFKAICKNFSSSSWGKICCDC